MSEMLKWDQVISDISKEQREFGLLGYNKMCGNISLLCIVLCVYNIEVFVTSHSNACLL
jgi:hypothetical protein